MSKYKITLDGTTYEMEIERVEGGEPAPVKAPEAPAVRPAPAQTAAVSAAPASGSAQTAEGTVVSPMPGTILSVSVAQGEAVQKGQPVLVLEAMKMENEIVAPKDGHIVALRVAQGDTVQGGDALFEIGE